MCAAQNLPVPRTVSQTVSLSGTPLAYPQADIPVYTCRYKQIQCLYMQIQDIHADT